MCGIAGIIFKDSSRAVSPELMREMTRAMVHRGPDDEGVYTHTNVGMGHRRLSIIDLSLAGHQPMTNEDETVWVVLNGEIYNFRELRAQLEKKGHIFKSHTDTEVVIHSYEEWGRECLQKFEGMFAFAVYDKKRKNIFLARDRVGIKPLYFYNDDKVCVFASEIKAILKTGFMRSDVNHKAIDFYMSIGYVPAPETIFRGIYKLEPGNYMIVSEINIEQGEYWTLNSGGYGLMSFDTARERFEELILECVGSHLVSDVPLGVFLSGGLDSSAMVAYMSRILKEPVKTFSVGYKDSEEVNELGFARKIADKFKTEHHEFILEPDDFFDSIDTFLNYSEEVIVESAAIALYQLSKVASSHVTVLLSGEGADELFGGYPLYWKMKQLERYHKFARFAPSSLSGPLSSVMSEKIQKYIHWISVPFESRYRTVSCDVIPTFKNRMYSGDFRKEVNGRVENFFDDVYSRLSGMSMLQKMLYVDTKYWLPDDLLVKADKMTMATSVELRVPFLDHKLVEFAFGLPDEFKIGNDQGKLIVKKAAESILPHEIIYRQKKGFPVPVGQWFTGDLYNEAAAVLLDKKTVERGYFNPDYIKNILTSHKKGEQDLSRRIFSLLTLELWHRKFADNIY